MEDINDSNMWVHLTFARCKKLGAPVHPVWRSAYAPTLPGREDEAPTDGSKPPFITF